MDGRLPPLPPLTRSESEQLARRRRGRNWAVFLALLALALLFYGMFIVKAGHY